MGIKDVAVATGKFIANNPRAALGIAGAVVGAGLTAKAFMTTPEVVKNSKYRGNLQFPNDLINPSIGRNYYMAIQFMEYQRRSIFNSPFLTALGGIRLPIPNNLTDTQRVTYDDSVQGSPTQGAAIEAGLQGRNNPSMGSFSTAAATAAGAAAGASIQAATAPLQSLGIDTNQILQLGGLAQNPFLTVLFKSPTFKRHTFTWRLSPNNPEESNTLRDIIQTFRSNMLPAMSGATGGTLLTYPNMAQISLFPNEDFLYKFKPCVVEQMSVNFAPGSTPSFFKGTDAPTEVTLSINFLEIEYWLKEDVENNSMRTKGAIL